MADAVPTGAQWAYEIKHDGFRFILLAFIAALGECTPWLWWLIDVERPEPPILQLFQSILGISIEFL